MQTCTRCIYDDVHIPYITFDAEGVCNYCRQADQLEREYPTGPEGEKIIRAMVERIKREQKGKKYDVAVGISGGCDSSYMLMKAVEWGLRPLAVHFDNTWNSTTAVENIHNIITNLKVDLYTLVVNSREFCDILHSFLKASVPALDIPTDIGLAATHYIAAQKYGIKYIFEGHSFRTEGISPYGWFYIDGKYISSVHKRFGTMKMKTFPNLTILRQLWWMGVLGIKKIRPLYYMDYNKAEAKKELAAKLGWKWYGGHHQENRSAYFTINYYLPTRFGIDLRYSEFSALIRAGQITREQGLEQIKAPKDYDPEITAEFKKRLGISEPEWEQIMNAPKRTHHDFKTYKKTFEFLRPLFWLLYKMDRIPKSFYMKYTIKYKDK